MFASRKTDHLSTPLPTEGGSTGFGENFALSLKRQLHVDSAAGFEQDIRSDFLENLDLAVELTGDPELKKFSADAYPRSEANLRLREILQNAKTRYPNIETYEEIVARRRDEAQELIDLQARTADRAGWAGMVGEFAGGTVGSMNPLRDPLYTITMLTGPGAARSLMGKVLVEAAFGATVAGLQQALTVNPRYVEQRLEGNQPLMNVLFGAGVGGIFGGVAHGIGRYAGRLSDARKAKALQRNIEARQRMSSKELVEQVEDKLPDTDEAQVAVEALKRDAVEEQAAADPTSYESRLETKLKVDSEVADMTGLELPPAKKTQLARLEVTDDSVELTARQAEPDKFDRLDATEREVDLLQKKLDETERALTAEQKKVRKEIREVKVNKSAATNIENRSLKGLRDQLDKLEDKDSGRATGLKRQIEAKEADVRARREGRPEKTIEDLRADVEHTKQNLANATNEHQRKWVAKALERKQKDLDRALEIESLKEVVSETREILAKKLRSRGEQQKSADSALRRARRRVEAEAAAEETTATKQPTEEAQSIEAINARLEAQTLEPAEAEAFITSIEVDDLGEVDLGLSERVNAEGAKILTDEGYVSVGDIIEDIKSDKDLIDAVNTCAIGWKEEFIMSFIECIAANLEAKKLTPKKAAKATDAFKRFLEEEEIMHGAGSAQAADAAAKRTVDAITNFNEAKVWARLSDMRKSASLWQRMQKTDTPDRLLIDVGNELESAKNTVLRETDAIIWRLIEEHRPRFAGLYRPNKKSSNIIRALYGEVVDDDAAIAMAGDWRKLESMWRRRANREGAMIPEPPEGRATIIQDNVKLRKMVKKLGYRKAQKEWVDDHIDKVDWSLLDGELMERSKEDILNDRFETYFSEGANKQAAGFHATALTDRLNGKQNTLYYATADAWEFINNKYGAGNAYQQLISARETWAKDIALLKVFGSNPENMIQHLTRDVNGAGMAMVRANAIAKKSSNSKIFESTKKEARTLRERAKIFSHLVANGEHSTTHQVINTTRTLTLTGILDGAIIANLGDMGFGIHQAAVNKIPATGYIRQVLGIWATMTSEQRRINALRQGLIGDGMVQMALNQQRYMGPIDGYAWARMVSDISYRAQGLNSFTQASRWGWSRQVMGAWADNRKTAWEKLPFREVLERYGITKDEWNLFRSTPINEEQGHLLLPIDLLNRKDINSQVAQRVSDKFFDVLNDTGRLASPSIDTRTQVALGYDTDLNTMRGQILRSFGALKSFPTFILLNHLQNGWIGATPQRLGYMVRFFATMTIFGAMITQMKEMAGGRDPRDMTDPSFWGRSALNGGSLGFLGDALFQNVNMKRGGGLASMMAGPYVEAVSSFRDATAKMLEGDFDQGLKEATELGETIIPIPQPFRLAAERLVWQEIMEMAYPRATTNAIRREQKRLSGRNQGTWWGVRGNIRPPDLGQAIGGADGKPLEFLEAFE